MPSARWARTSASINTWTVLHNRDPKDSLDTDALLLAPAVSAGAHRLPASVLLAPTNEDAEMRLLGSPDGIYAAIGLADPRRRFVALNLLEGEYDVQPIKTLLLPRARRPGRARAPGRCRGAGGVEGQRGGEYQLPARLGPGRTDVSPFMRRQIVHALGAIGSPTAEPALEGALADEAFAVRQAAVWALGEIGLPAAAPLVAARFEDVNPRVHREAAATLGLFKDSGANDSPVVRGFRKAFADSNQRTRLAAVRAATPLELRALAPAFIERLHDSDDEVQYAAVQAVSKLGAREAAPHLVPLLKSGGARVKHPEALCFIPATSYPPLRGRAHVSRPTARRRHGGGGGEELASSPPGQARRGQSGSSLSWRGSPCSRHE